MVTAVADAVTLAHGPQAITTRTAHGTLNRHRPTQRQKATAAMVKATAELRRQLRYATTKDARKLLSRQIRETEKAQRSLEAEQKAAEEEAQRKYMTERFHSHPWAVAQEALESHDGATPKADYPTCSAETVVAHFASVTAAPPGQYDLPSNEMLGGPVAEAMHWTPVNADMVAASLRAKKADSAPGADAVSNNILKHMHLLHDTMATVFNDLMKHTTCPPQWKRAIVKLIHKGDAADIPKNWRPISLTSCLGKLFHTIISRQIEQHCVGHGVIDTKIQKGFLQEMCGTTEHTQVLANILRDRRKRDRHFVMAQFDLVNAFGSPPREVLLKVMQWARLDPRVVAYITSLYDGATMELKLQAGLSTKIPVNRGVLQGDTLSPILFNLVMEVALRFVRHAFPSLGIRHDGELHFQKAYADDVTFLTVTPEDMQQA
eukprot:PhF_6_TR13451/c2_g3_i1/m.21527